MGTLAERNLNLYDTSFVSKAVSSSHLLVFLRSGNLYKTLFHWVLKRPLNMTGSKINKQVSNAYLSS